MGTMCACESAAAAEVEQQASHERALRATRPEPLRSAFEALLTASRERTPAFTQCAEKLAKKEAKQR